MSFNSGHAWRAWTKAPSATTRVLIHRSTAVPMELICSKECCRRRYHDSCQEEDRMTKKSWSPLTSGQQVTTMVLAVLEICLLAAALWGLALGKADEVRGPRAETLIDRRKR